MALLVLRRGQLVYERYFNGYLADSTAAQSGRPGRSEADQRNIERLGTPQAAFYAWQWRRRLLPGQGPPQPGALVYAQGLHGQVLMADPDSQTVALRLGQRTGPRHWPGWMEALLRLNP